MATHGASILLSWSIHIFRIVSADGESVSYNFLIAYVETMCGLGQISCQYVRWIERSFSSFSKNGPPLIGPIGVLLSEHYILVRKVLRT